MIAAYHFGRNTLCHLLILKTPEYIRFQLVTVGGHGHCNLLTFYCYVKLSVRHQLNTLTTAWQA